MNVFISDGFYLGNVRKNDITQIIKSTVVCLKYCTTKVKQKNNDDGELLAMRQDKAK